MIISRIKNYIKKRLAYRNDETYAEYLREKGVKVGNNCRFMYPKSIIIDTTRPSLVEIGDNVLLHRNFTLLTHDFVSRRFIEKYNDFIPSSGKVKIGNNVSFGMDCMVMKGVTIGNNCFIAAGSIVTSDIPSNSIASGNPCKVVSTIDAFYKFRREAYKKEAYIYAQSIQERYGRRPVPADFWEEFPLFVDKTNIDEFPEIPIRHQLNTAYSVWINEHKATFSSFDEFIDYALKYSPESEKESNDQVSEQNIPLDILDSAREIVSSVLKEKLSQSDDHTFMNDINGWDSLANMIILSQIEETYSISIPTEEMFNMTSIYKIAKVIDKLTNSTTNYKNISNLNPHSKLWSNICKNIESNPNKIAIKINDTSITYAKLYENVCKFASYLKAIGLKHRDKIIISAHKEIEYIYTYLASHILGVTNVIVDAESNKERLNYIEEKIQPKICFGYKSDKFSSVLFKDINIQNYDLLQQSTYIDNISENDIAEILFTTGTTGTPKGVCLSYSNIYGSASNINEFIQNSSDEIELLALPICHSFGMGRIRCTLLKGATIVILDGFGNVQKLFKTIEDDNVTGLSFVPAAWAYIQKISGKTIGKYANLIKYIEIGSAPMPTETKKLLLELFPDTRICMHYGLTEASRSTFQEFHDIEHLNSIGKPVTSNVDVKIIDKEGNEQATEAIGEICVKGNMVMKQYLDDDNSSSAFHGLYFRTGDNGYKDKDGYIYIVGREKEMINIGGKKVSPIEVEDAIMSLGVKDCVCVKYNDNSNILGEAIKCYILRGGTQLTFEEIAEKLSYKLERYKCPTMYEWIEQIPYTESGKKQRVKLQ